jgi:hypothetical protein
VTLSLRRGAACCAPDAQESAHPCSAWRSPRSPAAFRQHEQATFLVHSFVASASRRRARKQTRLCPHDSGFA